LLRMTGLCARLAGARAKNQKSVRMAVAGCMSFSRQFDREIFSDFILIVLLL
jgi:hypothetical protein